MVEDLVAWFRADAVSASWLTNHPDRADPYAPAEAEAGFRLVSLRAAGVEGSDRFGPHRALTHWLALDHDQPVGFASSFLDANVIDLCNLGVAESHRRRGIGRALVAARLADAVQRGATRVVSAPSPEGWRLQQTLGFRRVPVVADTWFYLPTYGRRTAAS